jgi:hypothetical protein
MVETEIMEFRNRIHFLTLPADINQITEVIFIRWQIFTSVAMNNAVLWDVTPGGSGKD